MTYPARHISTSINRPIGDVYPFIANPKNLSKWAAGVGQLGDVKVKFTEQNHFGVLDHDVTLPSGQVGHNPVRVISNGDGSEVIFTLFRLPGVTESAFEKDAQAIQEDLKKLKSILEN